MEAVLLKVQGPPAPTPDEPGNRWLTAEHHVQMAREAAYAYLCGLNTRELEDVALYCGGLFPRRLECLPKTWTGEALNLANMALSDRLPPPPED